MFNPKKLKRKETKTMDNLLNELNEVQLGKESMSCIKGGWVNQWSVKTKSGILLERLDPETGVYEWRLNGVVYFPHELGSNDRTLA